MHSLFLVSWTSRWDSSQNDILDHLWKPLGLKVQHLHLEIDQLESKRSVSGCCSLDCFTADCFCILFLLFPLLANSLLNPLKSCYWMVGDPQRRIRCWWKENCKLLYSVLFNKFLGPNPMLCWLMYFFPEIFSSILYHYRHIDCGINDPTSFFITCLCTY